jgi:hypothetical protein
MIAAVDGESCARCIVQLKLKYGRERIIVIISRVVVDVCLSSGIAEFFAARRRRLDALKIGNVFPPKSKSEMEEDFWPDMRAS